MQIDYYISFYANKFYTLKKLLYITDRKQHRKISFKIDRSIFHPEKNLLHDIRIFMPDERTTREVHRAGQVGRVFI